jgi:hypothetical protein
MKTISRELASILMVACLFSAIFAHGTSAIAAESCPRGSLRGNLLSQGSQARLSIRSESYRCSPPATDRSGSAGSAPTYTFEMLCGPNSEQGPRTLCSVAPCLQNNQSFALRNRRLPDGRLEPAGFACLTSSQASVSPGITLAQVFAAVRSVKLPSGNIHVAPASRGLANLKSFFWLEGASQAPVDLAVNGFELHAEFRVVEYRWSFGGGEPLVTRGPGGRGWRVR